MRAAAPTDREPSVVFFVLTTARAISRRAGARTTTMWGGDGDGEGASFRFNFGGDADADADPSASALPGATTSGTADVPSTADALVPASEVDPASAPDPTPGWSPETITVFDRTFVKGASSGAAARLVRGAGSDAAASDLVKGRYEGGFKLWECAEDLAAFLLRAGPATTRTSDPARASSNSDADTPFRASPPPRPARARSSSPITTPRCSPRSPCRTSEQTRTRASSTRAHILSIPRGRLGIPRRVQSVGTGIRGRRVGGGDGVRRE